MSNRDMSDNIVLLWLTMEFVSGAEKNSTQTKVLQPECLNLTIAPGDAKWLP